jgi:hypothetical protein
MQIESDISAGTVALIKNEYRRGCAQGMHAARVGVGGPGADLRVEQAAVSHNTTQRPQGRLERPLDAIGYGHIPLSRTEMDHASKQAII